MLGNLGNMLNFKIISSSDQFLICTLYKLDSYLKICFVKIQIISTLVFPSLTHDFRAGLAATKAAPPVHNLMFYCGYCVFDTFCIGFKYNPKTRSWERLGSRNGHELCPLCRLLTVIWFSKDRILGIYFKCLSRTIV